MEERDTNHDKNVPFGVTLVAKLEYHRDVAPTTPKRAVTLIFVTFTIGQMVRITISSEQGM